jgi:hypothetical protein
VLDIIAHPKCWKILVCNPNIPVAKEITPVVVDILQSYEEFKRDHSGIFKGIEKLKKSIASSEKHYLEVLISNPIKGVANDRVIDLQKSIEQENKSKAKKVKHRNQRKGL